MRKMKKINGYLVVRFNDREKREYEGTALGSYGVIDAELYTGVLDIDRGVMEYDNAETLETAIELARGLESELDVAEPEKKVTVIVEDETEFSEEEFEPEQLFLGEKSRQEQLLRNGFYPVAPAITAAHRLAGYVRALEDLGIVDSHDERFMVTSETFQDAAVCEKHEAGRHTGDPPALTPEEVRELGSLRGLLKELNDYANSGDHPSPPKEPEAERDNFVHMALDFQRDRRIRRAYALGFALTKECPENDCEVYLNIFNMAQELDKALDEATGYPATVLQKALHDQLRALRGMYNDNYAIQQYKKRKGAQHE